MFKKNLGIFIAVFLVTAIATSVYQQMTKKTISAKATRLVCQKKTTTFEKIFKKDLMKKAQDLLKSNNYILKSRVWKSKYEVSKLFNFISKEDIDNKTIQSISKYIKNDNSTKEKLIIQFYTRENDMKDPGKKTKKSKLYAGYLVYEFKLDNKLVYKIQTDFMDFHGKDISNRINCIFKSFTTL
jgi:hypothetical protein